MDEAAGAPKAVPSARCRYTILNGFDRSGTSMIAKVLGTHPGIEVIFQPFSRTVLQETQWEAWPPERACPEVDDFLAGLLEGRLDRAFIRSDWFANHSSTADPVPGRLHVIKTTKLHFKTAWFRTRWPQFPFYGIYRDPRAVLGSLVRNGFHLSWYGRSAFEAAGRYLVSRDDLDARYGVFLRDARSDVERMAVALAVRTEVMAESLPTEDWIVYEEVVSEPNTALNAFVARFGLEPRDFAGDIGRDHNVVGKPFEGTETWRSVFGPAELKRLEPILSLCPGPRGRCGAA